MGTPRGTPHGKGVPLPAGAAPSSPPLIRYSLKRGRRKFPARVVREGRMPGNISAKPVEPVTKLQKAPTQRMPWGWEPMM